jgi:hypothetical protein
VYEFERHAGNIGPNDDGCVVSNVLIYCSDGADDNISFYDDDGSAGACHRRW